MDEHEHYGPGQPMNAADVAAIIAERDRLRAVVERAHDHVGVDEQVLRSLATGDLVALVGVLRQDCRDAMIESDRLRAAARDLVAAAKAWRNMLIIRPLPAHRQRVVQAFADAVDAFDPMLSETTEPLDVSAYMGWHCRCGTRYDVGQSICPDCGTARQRMPGSAESWDAAAGEKP